MESSDENQKLSLQQFLFDLATNPQLQLKLAGIYQNTLYKFLIEQGLSDEDARLFADAQMSDEGKTKLAQKLTGGCTLGTWSCSQNVVMEE